VLARELSVSAARRQEQTLVQASAAIDHGLLDERLGYWTRRVQIGIFQDFFQAFRQTGLRPAQYSTLIIIEQNPGLTQTQVADTLGIKKANFVALIRELESRALVQRRPDPSDRRSYGLFLSEQGARLMPELHKASGAHEQRLRAALGEAAYRETLANLRLLSTALNVSGDEEPTDAAPTRTGSGTGTTTTRPR
jgi:DNA-binding MarR family transcriptional regulator